MLESRPPAPATRCRGIPLDARKRNSVTRLSGKVALITGGGTGIGRAIALAFAREGASVTVAGRRLEKLREVISEVQKQGGAGLAMECDVSRAKGGDGGQHKGAVSDVASGAAGISKMRRGSHREYRVGAGTGGHEGSRGVLRVERRRDDADKGHGHRSRAREHPRELHLPFDRGDGIGERPL